MQNNNNSTITNDSPEETRRQKCSTFQPTVLDRFRQKTYYLDIGGVKPSSQGLNKEYYLPFLTNKELTVDKYMHQA